MMCITVYCSSSGSEVQINVVDSLLRSAKEHAEKTQRFYTERQYTNPIPSSFYHTRPALH